MPNEDQTKPLAVVTGGGTGIGRAVAELLAESGYQVIALGLDRDADLSAAIAFHKVDLTDTKASIAALPQGQPVAGLVNCAGMLRHQQEWETDAFEQVMRVNVTAGFAFSAALLDRLQAAGGAVVNVASMWAIFGSPGAPAYTASKGRRRRDDPVTGGRLGRTRHSGEFNRAGMGGDPYLGKCADRRGTRRTYRCPHSDGTLGQTRRSRICRPFPSVARRGLCDRRDDSDRRRLFNLLRGKNESLGSRHNRRPERPAITRNAKAASRAR